MPRSKAENPNVAVLILASKQQPYDNQKGLSARADDFIEKPFDTQQLVDKVKRLASRPVEASPATRARSPRRSHHATWRSPAGPTGEPPLRPSAARDHRSVLRLRSTRGPLPPAWVARRCRPPQAGELSPMAGIRPPAAQPLPPPSAAPLLPPAAVGPLPSAARLRPHQPRSAPSPPAHAIASAPLAANGQLAAKLQHLGLTEAQVSAVLALSREVVEKVVWEVVPVLAETMIKEEIKRLTSE